MFCNKCGVNMPAGSAHCPACGAPAAVAPSAPQPAPTAPIYSAPTPASAYSAYPTYPAEPKKGGKGLGIMALIFSILGACLAVVPLIISIVTLANGEKLDDYFVLTLILTICSGVLTILGFVFGLVAKSKGCKGLATGSIISGIAGIAVCIGATIVMILAACNEPEVSSSGDYDDYYSGYYDDYNSNYDDYYSNYYDDYNDSYDYYDNRDNAVVRPYDF